MAGVGLRDDAVVDRLVDGGLVDRDEAWLAAAARPDVLAGTALVQSGLVGSTELGRAAAALEAERRLLDPHRELRLRGQLLAREVVSKGIARAGAVEACLEEQAADLARELALPLVRYLVRLRVARYAQIAEINVRIARSSICPYCQAGIPVEKRDGLEPILCRRCLCQFEDRAPSGGELHEDEPPAPEGPAFPHRLGESYPRSDRYVLGELLGAGGMGLVFRVTDGHLHRDLALKVASDRVLERPDLRERFLREARITSLLEHPGIVPVLDVGEDAQGRPFYVMKLVRGRSLADVVRGLASGDPETERRFGLVRRVEILRLVAQAVAHAHSRGVIHRDLKPSNVMVGEFDEVLVMDWGLARVLRERTRRLLRLMKVGSSAADPEPVDLGDEGLTSAGAILGTPTYMSPEQGLGREADFRSDVYSLGALLLSLLVFREPIDLGRPHVVVSSRVTQGRIDWPGDRPGDPPVHPEIRRIVERAMAHAPLDRYPSPIEMIADIDRWLERSQGEPVPWSREVTRRFLGTVGRSPSPRPSGESVAFEEDRRRLFAQRIPLVHCLFGSVLVLALGAADVLWDPSSAEPSLVPRAGFVALAGWRAHRIRTVGVASPLAASLPTLLAAVLLAVLVPAWTRSPAEFHRGGYFLIILSAYAFFPWRTRELVVLAAIILGSYAASPLARTGEAAAYGAAFLAAAWALGSLASRQLLGLLEDRHRLETRLRIESRTDPLTGFWSAACLAEHGPRQAVLSLRTGGEVAAIALSIDPFLSVLEGRGHESAERCLREVADRIGECLGDHEMPFRIAGDDLLVLSLWTGPAEILDLARRIRKAVESRPLAAVNPALMARVHVGVARLLAVEGPGGRDFADGFRSLLAEADAARLRARQAGAAIEGSPGAEIRIRRQSLPSVEPGALVLGPRPGRVAILLNARRGQSQR